MAREPTKIATTANPLKEGDDIDVHADGSDVVVAVDAAVDAVKIEGDATSETNILIRTRNYILVTFTYFFVFELFFYPPSLDMQLLWSPFEHFMIVMQSVCVMYWIQNCTAPIETKAPLVSKGINASLYAIVLTLVIAPVLVDLGGRKGKNNVIYIT